MNPRVVTAYLLLVLAWGSSYLWTNIAVRELGPFHIVGYRLALGVLVLLPVVLAIRPPLPRLPRVWLALVTYSIVGICIPLWLVAWGQQYIASSKATVIIASAPIFTLVLAHIFLKDDKMTPRRVLGLLMGFGGVVVLMSKNLQGGQIGFSLWAEGSQVLVALCYASGTVFARRFTQGYSPVLQAMVAQGAAAMIVLSLVKPMEGGFLLPSLPITWLAVAWVGIFSTGLAFILFYYLLHTIGPTRTQTVNFPILFIGVFLGMVFLDEPLTWHMAAGGLLIAGSLFVVHTAARSAG